MTVCTECQAVMSFGNIEKKICKDCKLKKLEEENRLLKMRKVGRPTLPEFEKKKKFVLMVSEKTIIEHGSKKELEKKLYNLIETK